MTSPCPSYLEYVLQAFTLLMMYYVVPFLFLKVLKIVDVCFYSVTTFVGLKCPQFGKPIVQIPIKLLLYPAAMAADTTRDLYRESPGGASTRCAKL